MKTENRIFRCSNYTLITFLFIVTKLILHLLTNTNYELHRDELLYFNMADHLSTGYATVPPLTGFFAFLARSIFGYSVFGIRLLPALMGTLSMFIISRIVKQLGGGIPALIIASASFLLSPGFMLLNTVFTPNVFEQFLWLLFIWVILRMVILEKPVLWIFSGIILGVSFLFKYSVVFLIAGFFTAFISCQYRNYLKSGYFFIAIIIGLIIIAPNIIWQYRHNWPVAMHINELNRTQLSGMTPLMFLTDLFSLTLGSTIVWVFGLFVLLFIKAEKRFRFLGVASLTVILLLVLLKGKGYYVSGIIPFLFASGGYAMEKYLTGRLIILRNSLLVIILTVSFIAMPTGLPLLTFDKYMEYREKTSFLKIYPFFMWEDGKVHELSQVYSDMTGWSELTAITAKAFNMLSEDEKRNCTIYCNKNYGYAGAIHFYGKKYGLPEAITFSESYTFWAPDTIADGPLIYFNPGEGDQEELFSEITLAGVVSNEYFRENGAKVYVCRSPKKDIPEVYRTLALKEKSVYE